MNEPILTGKAEIDFDKWIEPFTLMTTVVIDGDKTIINDYWETCKLALIQEWLDSVGIFTDAKPFKYSLEGWKFSWSVEGFVTNKTFDTRTEALKAALIKANNIYNSKQCTTSTQS